jgi:hypothetical protein
MNYLIRRGAPALAFSLVVCAPAYADDEPASTTAASVPLRYQSAFADYKPYQDIEPGDWRALNESVKGDSMAGMDMSGMQGHGDMKDMPRMQGHGGMKDMPRMRGTSESANQGMSMPATKPPAHGHPHAPAKSASVPGMPDMAPHAGHDVNGGRQ